MTAEQEALLHKARDSLKAARMLADQEFYDFAVSRAYYTMFKLQLDRAQQFIGLGERFIDGLPPTNDDRS